MNQLPVPCPERLVQPLQCEHCGLRALVSRKRPRHRTAMLPELDNVSSAFADVPMSSIPGAHSSRKSKLPLLAEATLPEIDDAGNSPRGIPSHSSPRAGSSRDTEMRLFEERGLEASTKRVDSCASVVAAAPMVVKQAMQLVEL